MTAHLKKEDKFDKIIHERVRLLIVTHLATSENQCASFTETQQHLGLTSGNLSVQLKKLSQSGYVDIKKTFKDNKPLTTVCITSKGQDALDKYINEMENIIQILKNSNKKK